jgi:branched-chain amino acid transport system substrate-binding protein
VEFTAGLSISLTGEFARFGREALQAMQLWAESANARLVYYDDESSAALAVEHSRRLLAQDRVDILFGPYSSGLARAAAKAAEEQHRILWNHGGSSDDVSGQLVVCTPSPASAYFRQLPRWLSENEPDMRKITVMRSACSPFAGHVARGLTEEAEEAGYSVELALFSDRLSGGAEVLVLAGNFEEEVRIIRSRPAARIIAAVAAGVGAFHEAVGSLADRVIGPSQWEPGPESESFVHRFQERFGRTPEYIAAGAFGIGLIAEECIRRAASLDDRRLRDVAADLDLETFYGRFRIDPETGRQTGHRIRLVRWRQGRKQVISA